MQTVTLQIREERLEQFLKIIEGLRNDIVETYEVIDHPDEDYLMSENFRKDKKMFHQRLEDIRQKEATLLREEAYREKMADFVSDLKKRYADS